MAFDDLQNVDFTGETKAQLQDLFRTDPYALCRVGQDILEKGPEGVAKAATRKINSAVDQTISNMAQTFAKEFNLNKTLNIQIGDYTANINLKIDGAQKILQLMESGRIITPDGIDVAALKRILDNLDPTSFADGISKNFNRNKIGQLIGSFEDSVFEIKQQLTSSLASFSPNGAQNLKKMISLQGICNAAAAPSFELGLKTAIAQQLNSQVPNISLGEIKVLTDILL